MDIEVRPQKEPQHEDRGLKHPPAPRPAPPKKDQSPKK